MVRNTPEGRANLHAQYEELALAARSAAGAETLENARQKLLTAAATWERLARDGRKMSVLRDRRNTERLALIAASE
jgi:hypothetical protein